VKKIKYFVIYAMICLLGACGGGGGDPGKIGSEKSDSSVNPNNVEPNPSDSNNPSNAGSAVSDFEFEFDKLFIQNSGSDKATLKVTALDANNNVLAGAPVTVKVSTAIFTGITASAKTGSDGTYSGVIKTGLDKSNRTVPVTITAGGVTKAGFVYVRGSLITANLTPSNPAPGELTTLELMVKDSADIPIPFAKATLSGTFGLSGTETADASGVITKKINAPANPGKYELSVNGLGATFTRDIQVTSGVIPAAAADINSSSLSVAPTALSPNSNGSILNEPI